MIPVQPCTDAVAFIAEVLHGDRGRRIGSAYQVCRHKTSQLTFKDLSMSVIGGFLSYGGKSKVGKVTIL